MSAEMGRAPRFGSVPDSDLGRLVDNLPGMAYRCRNDEERTMLFVSGGSRALTGFAPADLTTYGMVSYARLIREDDRLKIRDHIQRALADGRDFTVTYRIRRADGGERWVWEQGRGVPDQHGDVLFVEGYVVDITGRYELAAQLAEAETWNRILMDQPLVGVYIIEDRRFRYVNARFAEIFGRSTGEMLGLPSVLDVVDPSDRAAVGKSLDSLHAGRSMPTPLRFRAIHATGRPLHVEVHRSCVVLGGSRVVIGVLIDITDQIESERRAQHLQKMEAMGRLAAGIAHDFRNVLSTIRVTAQLLEEASRSSPSNPEVAEDLRDIIDAVDRGSRLSEHLMELSRNRVAAVQHLSLATAVGDLAPMLRRILGTGITLVQEADEGLPDVVMDRGHLEQIVMNLVVNARDAMPQGGEVTVRVRLKRPPADTRVCVCLEVSDTGPGVPAELRTRVFEPYFTTKEDKGTGLGLTNVWTIAQSYGGLVGLESEAGRGTTFSVYFPVPAADAGATTTD
ncbi:MAG: PAS domain S-box protein [Gemmatimonadetes bacterium]|nr:PAS domain S-box protein [Gemmatimonadota bacterium]